LITEAMFDEFDHAARGSLAVIIGEAELVLLRADVSAEERRRSVDSVIGAVREIERMLAGWRGRAGGPPR
jgi:hypothetical protein